MITKPNTSITSDYFAGYVNKAQGVDLVTSLTNNLNETIELFSSLSEEQGNFMYADGKWTVKQLLQHVIDTERIFANRALRMARKDATPLPGYEEDDYAANDNTSNLSLDFVVNDFRQVRASTITLFQSLDKGVLDFEGMGSNVIFTPRIIGWMLSGHCEHHNNVLKERYLKD